ncbi:MAG: hypothetical protein ACNYPI_10210 [Arenicellales bacterium WSBS_2016_MAG_OTU3]
MSSSESFTDLRTASHNASGISDESVWPSFTDIMTVIMMIFLMSLLVILLRNDELIVELKLAMLSEQATVEFAQEQTGRIDELLIASTLLTEKKAKLENQLSSSEQSNTNLTTELGALKNLRDRLSTDKIQLESDIALLQQQYETTKKNLETMQAERAELRKQNADLDNLLRIAQQETVDLLSREALQKTERKELLQKLSDIAGSKTQLETTISNVEKERDDLEKLKQSLEQSLSDEKTKLVLNIGELNKSYEAAQNRQTELEKETLILREELALRPKVENITMLESEIQILEQQFRTQQEKYAAEIQGRSTLQGDFEELKRKYNLAVKPARSTEGKYVAGIRIRKVGGNILFELREPDTGFVGMSRFQLEERLSNLKARDPYKLYTKVIFPEDSNLSYNEAFALQTDLQSRFDYYDHGKF